MAGRERVAGVRGNFSPSSARESRALVHGEDVEVAERGGKHQKSRWTVGMLATFQPAA